MTKRDNPTQIEKVRRALRRHDAAELSGTPKIIFERAQAVGVNYADMSRAIGKNQAYVHQYLFKGTPKHLDESARAGIAQLLGINPDELRDRPMIPSIAAFTSGPEPSSRGIRRGIGIPLFRETETIEMGHAQSWVPAITTGTSVPSLAVWIERPGTKLAPGDIAFATTNHPVRETDQVVVLIDKKVTCHGQVRAVSANSLTVECLSRQIEFRWGDVQVLKIIGVTYP